MEEFTRDPENKAFTFLIDPELNAKFMTGLKEKLKNMGAPLGDVKIKCASQLGKLKMCKECLQLMIMFRPDIDIESLTFFTF
jgi:hypothetical protein